ncbi:hypothetical protein CALCODRAFT_519148 [Calocera cornea HHB12733]|uniref:DUF6533 domain-containing protein n=1 Tax=Calocera cornea HHB12733 TaxID=1353952 RepID=A0A165EEW0_9BASI|nr:hypothetical protein CALCODRAFT_519148 [Calocera cornea HHB12733]
MSSSGFTAEQIEATIDLVNVYELTRRAALAALVWALYDYFITLSTELTHVWLEHHRQGWQSGIVELLITDNVAAFALVLLVQTINLVILLVAEPQEAQAGVGFSLASDVIIGSRLLLHTKEVINSRRNPYETEIGMQPVAAFEVVTPNGGRSFAAALRDSYGGSSSPSDGL